MLVVHWYICARFCLMTMLRRKSIRKSRISLVTLDNLLIWIDANGTVSVVFGRIFFFLFSLIFSWCWCHFFSSHSLLLFLAPICVFQSHETRKWNWNSLQICTRHTQNVSVAYCVYTTAYFATLPCMALIFSLLLLPLLLPLFDLFISSPVLGDLQRAQYYVLHCTILNQC